MPAFPDGAQAADQGVARPSDALDDVVWVVDLEACGRQRDRFQPREVLVYRTGTVTGELQPATLDDLTQAAAPDVPVCVLVHGYSFSRERAVEDARWAFSHIRSARGEVPMTQVLFHWPSELDHAMPWPLVPFDLRVKGNRADLAGHYLAWLTGQFPSEQPICIVSHSMGCRVAASGLHLMGGGESRLAGFTPQDRGDRPVKAVFLAAAMEKDWLWPGKRYGDSIPAADEVVLVTNRKDYCLRWFPWVNFRSGASLGRDGFNDEELRRMNHLAERVRVVSVADEMGRSHTFRKYSQTNAVAELVATTLGLGDRDKPTVAQGVRRLPPVDGEQRESEPVVLVGHEE
jgi:hypothetical protein